MKRKTIWIIPILLVIMLTMCLFTRANKNNEVLVERFVITSQQRVEVGKMGYITGISVIKDKNSEAEYMIVSNRDGVAITKLER